MTKRETDGDSQGQPGKGASEERFLKAFDEHGDALFRHASYRLSDRERAIEIVHDTFTKVWGYIRDGHTIDSFKPFLYKVLNNLIIDEYRKRREVSLDALLDDEPLGEATFEELTTGSIEEVTFSLDAKRAADHLHELSPAYKEVLVLRYVDGLRPKEISELIEVSENVVSVRIYRGLRMLEELIKENEEKAEEKRKNITE